MASVVSASQLALAAATEDVICGNLFATVNHNNLYFIFGSTYALGIAKHIQHQAVRFIVYIFVYFLYLFI